MINKKLLLLIFGIVVNFHSYSQWTDITSSIGGGLTSTTNMAKPYVFDVNNDNYPDFLVPVLTSVVSPYTKYWKLYKNNGNSTFTDATTSYGLPTNLSLSTLGFIDYNGDGFKDLYFYTATGLQILKNNNGTSFTDVSTQLGIASAFFISGEITSYPLKVFDYDLDGDEDLLYTRTISGANTLTAIVNNGTSFSTKVNIINSIPGATTGGINFSLFDMDNDGDFDIVFDAFSGTLQYSNGITTLYRKDAASYTNTTSTSGLANGLPGYISTIDINQDGNLDIVKGGADCCTSPLYRVFIGNGTGVFTEQTSTYSISNGGYKYNGTLTDFDNDTDFDFSWSNYTGTGAAPFRLYVNNGSNVFTENATTYGLNLGVTSGGVPIDDYGNGVWMDLDKDGDLDIILNREGSGSTSTTGNVWVKRNPLQGNYINIKLNGCGVNKSGIGAKIKLVVGTKTKWLYYEKSPDGNITNGTDTFHFGLGSATLINSITVYWPNNTITVLNNVSGNQFLTIGGGVGSSSAPTGSTSQTLCSGSTIANLTSAIGTNIQWYATSTGGTALASTTALINGTTYYASQTVNSCESTSRLAVIISLNNPSVTASATSVCAGQSTTLTASSGNSTITNFSVGSIGPSGGYVFYDQGSVINGWRYLEAAPSNIQNSSWGCGDVNIFGSTSLAIGSGLTNTNAIVNTCTASTIAAKRCLDYSLNGYDDWYLPSQNEFSQIYQNLILNNLGNFNVGAIPTKGTLYWTSSQLTAASGSHFCLECGGNFYQYSKIYELYVRPIRQFSSGTPFSSYLWSTGETTPTINASPNQNTQYWVDVTTNGVTCRKYITITVDSTTSAPTGSTSQTLCSGSTIDNLTATGTNIKWYSTSTGGTALTSTTALVNGTIYYASQTVQGCESTTRLAVTVNFLTVNAPTGTAIQYFCGQSTIASLVLNGSSIKWYATSTGGAELPLTTLISNGAFYYASNNINNCESTTRYAVRGYIKNTSLTASSTTICGGSPVTLTASDSFSSSPTFLWSTGDTTASLIVTPQVSTTYWVEIISFGSSCRKYISIIVNNPSVSASNTILCQPGTVTIKANSQAGLSTNSCSSTILSTNLQTNLLAWYPFCENVNDQTSNNHNGTVTGTTTYVNDRNNNPSSAFFFDGATKIQIPHNNSLNAFPFSVSAWVKSSDLEPGHIIGKYENATWNGWGIAFEPKGSGFYLRGRNSALISGYDDYPEFSTPPMNDNSWHNLVFVADQYSGRIYLDGVLQDTQLWRGTPGIANSSWPMIIGYYAHTYQGIGSDTGYFNGATDDIGVWGRALTEVEVQQLYSLQRTATYLWSTGATTATINPSVTQTTQYWVDITLNGITCRKNITVTVIPNTAPTGANNQTMTQGSTLANLVVTGQNIVWYSTPFGGTPLPANNTLVNGVTYYASQTINGCESQYRLPVIVEVTLSNKEFDTIKIVYNPNPVTDILNIKASTELKNAKIFNLLGQTIFQQTFNSKEIQLNMSDFPTGTYFVLVESDDINETFKIVKK